MRAFTIALLPLLVLAAAPAHAELIVADSVEWVAVDSAVVVVGTVAASRELGRQGRWGAWRLVTLEVTETLAGPKNRRVSFATPLPPRDAGPPAGEVIAFLVPSTRYDGPKTLPTRLITRRHSFAWDERLGVLPLAELESRQVAGRDASHRKTRAALLASLRRALKLRSARPKSFRMDTPFDSDVARALYSGSAVELIVPVDADLIAWAATRVESRLPHERLHGARALATTTTTQTIRLLRDLLEDPAVWTHRRGSEPERKVFSIRRVAWEALTSWGVDIPKPVLEKPATAPAAR